MCFLTIRRQLGKSLTLLASVSIGCLNVSIAQSLPQEYSKLIRSQQNVAPLDINLHGDRIDYQTGQITFTAVDVELPGNNALPVSVGRRFVVETNPNGIAEAKAFGDWDIDLPRIEGIVSSSVGWTVPGTAPLARCSRFGIAPPASTTNASVVNPNQTITTSIPWEQYSTGYSLHVPGLGSRELLVRSPGNTEQPTQPYVYPIVSNDWWMVRCLSSLASGSPGSGEGFLITSPDGVEYTLDWLITPSYIPLSRPADTSEPAIIATLPRALARMLITKARDRFGNTVTYTYGGAGADPDRLTRIESSDGRVITLTYNADKSVHSINAGSRTWKYGYNSNKRMNSVTLPDNSKWSMDFESFNGISWNYSNPWVCGAPGAAPSNFNATGTITHPSGAKGEFEFGIVRRGRSSPTTNCYMNSAGIPFASVQPAVYDVVALTKKRITGPEIGAALQWTITYEGCSQSSCNSTAVTKITDPRGFITEYTFGTVYNDNEGLLLKKTSGTGIQTEDYEYHPSSGQAFPAQIGIPSQVRGDAIRLATVRPLKKRTITRNGTTYSYTANSLDKFGFPGSIVRSGTETKTETITYSHNLSKWILGPQLKITSSGQTEIERTFNENRQPTRVDRFGLLDNKYSWNADGTLASLTDGNSHMTTYVNWFRGIPKNISHPGTGSETLTVSNSGKIMSWKDENGWITNLVYDNMDRLSSITYPPVGQTFSTTSFTWSTSQSGWMVTETAGAYQKETRLDALLRPVLVAERDGGGNYRYANTKYDKHGPPSFSSNESNIPSEGSGTTFTYDGLMRLKSSNANGYPATYTWMGGSRVHMIDRRGISWYTTYKNYDEPLNELPVKVDGPIYSTTIDRDSWGKPKSITRNGVTHRWTYNSGQQLCGTYSPERGTISYRYDGAGNIDRITTAPGNIGCGATGNPITKTYNERDRVTGVSYPNSSLNIVQEWFQNGLLKSSKQGNIERAYQYNGRRLLTSEDVKVDSIVYSLDYGYDSLGHLSSTTYPDGTMVNYSPSAFGEPSEVGDVAKSIKYHPNGMVSSFRYGNNISHSTTLNPQKRILRVYDLGAVDLTYSYDGNGNPTGITDGISVKNGIGSQTMTYDNANRLKTANAPNAWGNSTYTYNDSDDITRSIIGPTLTDYNLNTSNRLASVITGGVSSNITYDDRGNIIQKGAMSYSYDEADRLKQVITGTPGVTGTLTMTNRFDSLGFRIVGRSITEGLAQDPPDIVTSIYSSTGLLMYEKLENIFGFPTSIPRSVRYLYLGSRLIARQNISGAEVTTSYVHVDASGSTIAETNSGGAAVKRSRYLPYGASLEAFPSIGPGFTGHYMDRAGLIYMRQRYYDPALARFTSPDPVGSSAVNFNRFWYANNNPYTFIDPDGRQSFFLTPTKSELDYSIGQSRARAMQHSSMEGKNLIAKGGVTGMLGAPAIGNSITSPSLTLIANVSVLVNLTDPQIGIQGNFTPAASLGGGVMLSGDVGIELSDGPLATGLSTSNTTFAQITPDGKIDIGASYSWSDTSRSVGFGLKGGVGNYIGVGTGPTFTGTAVYPDPNQRKEIENR